MYEKTLLTCVVYTYLLSCNPLRKYAPKNTITINNYNHGIKDELTPLYHVGTSNSPVKRNKTPFTTYSSLDNPTSLITMSLMLIASSFGTGLTRSL